MGVHHVHTLARHQVRKRSCGLAERRKLQRLDRQAGVVRQPGKQRAAAAPDEQAVAAARELLAQIEDRLCRAGRPALVGQLEDREGRVTHWAKW